MTGLQYLGLAIVAAVMAAFVIYNVRNVGWSETLLAFGFSIAFTVVLAVGIALATGDLR